MKFCAGDGRGPMSDEDDDDFYDAMSEQMEEIKIALPSDKKSHQSVHFIIYFAYITVLFIFYSDHFL